MINYDEYKVNVPEGRIGIWRVERFKVSKEDASRHNLCEQIHGGRREIEEGTYTKLVRGDPDDDPIMSDTPPEIRDHLYPIRMATGRVLINGLGIGVVLQACLKKPDVTYIKVIEKSGDVIKLVAPHYLKQYPEKLEVVNEDAYEYKLKKDERYDMIYSDVWDNICVDNWESYKQLK